MARKKTKFVYPDQLDENVVLQTSDVGREKGLTRDVISKFIWWEGQVYWQALHHTKGIYFTPNPNDPKILNYANEAEPRCRGSIKFMNGEGGNPAGKPKGASNRISVKNVCDSMNANPVELLVAVMTSDVGTLRRYGVKDVKGITLAQKLGTAKYLTDKLVPNLKPAGIGEDGEYRVEKDASEQEKSNQLQTYIPQFQNKHEVKPILTKEEESALERDGEDVYLTEYEQEDVPNTPLAWEVLDDSREG